MPFTVRAFEDIVRSEVDYLVSQGSALTDFTPGSNVRTLLEAPATELEKLYAQFGTALAEQIAEAGYAPFDFGLLSAKAATLLETVTLAQTAVATAVTIQAGTLVGVPGTTIQYAVTATTTATTSTSAQVTMSLPLQCTVPGSLGNVPIGAITSWASTPPANVVSLTNTARVTTGTDTESPEERATRFAAFISSLARGPLVSIEYGASLGAYTNPTTNVTESVGRARALDNSRDSTIALGVVRCYIFNGVGTPLGLATSSSLVAATQKIIDGYTDVSGTLVAGYKGGGIPCTVLAATEILCSVAVSGTVVKPGYTVALVTGGIQSAITSYFTSLQIGQNDVAATTANLLLSSVRAAISAVPGVADYTLVVTVGGTPLGGNYTTPSGSLLVLQATNPITVS
jgi:uncharacterized phage protein gp47/JayE